MLAMGTSREIIAITEIIRERDHFELVARAEARLQMIGRQVRIPHGHRDRGVTEDPLQAEDVPASHHVVAGKGVPKDVGHLSWCVETTALVGRSKRGPAGHEQAAIPGHPNFECYRLYFGRNGHRSRLADLGPVKVHLAAEDRVSLHRLRFIPPGAGGEADQGHRVGVVVRRLTALLEELFDLRQREKRQFDLVRIDLVDFGQWVNAYPGPEANQLRKHGRQVGHIPFTCMRASSVAIDILNILEMNAPSPAPTLSEH
ncbi:hypothetical protein D3C80_1135570 [compost metagenome]